MVNPKVKSGSSTTSPTVPELISELRSSFFASDFQILATKFTEHEEIMDKRYNELKNKSEEEKNLLLSEKLKLKKDLKKKETETEALKKENDECEKKVRVCKKLYMDLIKRVIVLEEKAEEFEEMSRPDLSNKKGHSTKRTETKLQEIIEIVDNDDDDDVVDDDDQYIGTLKRKRVAEEIKKRYNSDLESSSSVKTKRASKDSNSDYVDYNQTVTQKRKNLEESPSQQITSTDTKKVEKSTAAKMKIRKEKWESEDDMMKDFEKDDQLCLDAVCAMRRQKVIVHGSDIARYAKLTRLLMDGDLLNKPQKKASELDLCDLDDCRVLARIYKSQIFGIYERKIDPFFPT
ncbi:uncharacterized protein [Rutidosis leptorrhynchoides]|uniref:uncharacterized protein isoform X2 n=1 Tax=Rutidosis leptorrhynchoides TaxID=125765 RepID=UPI003A998193